MSESLPNPESSTSSSTSSSVPSSGISVSKWVETYDLGNRETVRQMLETFESVRGVSLSPGAGSGRLIDAPLSALLFEVFTQAKQGGIKPVDLWKQRLEQSQAPKDELAVAARTEVGQFRAELVAATQVLFTGLAEEYRQRVAQDTSVLVHEGQLRLTTVEESRRKQLEVLDGEFKKRLVLLEEEHERRLNVVVAQYDEQVVGLRNMSVSLGVMQVLCQELRDERAELIKAVTAVSTVKHTLEVASDAMNQKRKVTQDIVTTANRLLDGMPNQKFSTLVLMGVWFVLGVLGCLVIASMRPEFVATTSSRAGVFVVALVLATLCVGLRDWMARRFKS